MSNANAPQNLTKEERESLMTFIGRSVLENAKFPGMNIGTNNVTIQELVNERTITSLENYGDMIEKRVGSQGSSFKSKKGPVKFSNILATDLINALHLIIKLKEFEQFKSENKARIAELKEKINNNKSKDEIVAEAKAELLLLEQAEA